MIDGNDFADEYQAIIDHITAMAATKDLEEWKRRGLEAIAITVRMWFLEEVPAWKQRAREAESTLETLRSALRDIETPVSGTWRDLYERARRIAQGALA